MSKEKKGKKVNNQSYYRVSLAIFKKNRLAMFCLGIVIILVLIAIFAPALTKYDPNQTKPRDRFQSPNAEHPMGTDNLGRDVFARLVNGGKMTMTIGALAVVIETVIGVILGGLAGYFGGIVDMVIMRLAEIIGSDRKSVV